MAGLLGTFEGTMKWGEPMQADMGGHGTNIDVHFHVKLRDRAKFIAWVKKMKKQGFHGVERQMREEILKHRPEGYLKEINAITVSSLRIRDGGDWSCVAGFWKRTTWKMPHCYEAPEVPSVPKTGLEVHGQLAKGAVQEDGKSDGKGDGKEDGKEDAPGSNGKKEEFFDAERAA